jgi:predicted Zn-dependent protease
LRIIVRRIRFRDSCIVGLAWAVLAWTAVASHAMPVAEEQKIGEEIAMEARRHLPLIADYEIDTFISGMGNRIVKTLGTQPFKYEFFVVRDDSINAFAVPGGKVFVHAGLIARAANEDEIAGVMAHEIAHASAHHSVRQQQKGQVANYATLLGVLLSALNPVVGSAAMTAGMSQQLKYQRDFEREADFLGIDFAKQAGYEPGAMLGMLRKINAQQQLNPTAVPPYLQSHPLTGERMSYLEASLGKSEWQVKTKPASQELLRVQAIARANAQTRKEAVPDYERGLAAATPQQRPQALELIGVLMAHGDDYALAIGYLEQAEKAGRQVDRELGRCYLRKGRLDDARPRLLRATAAAPKDWNAQSDLGDLYYQMGEYDPSVEAYRKSVAAYPWLPDVQQSLGRALNKANKVGEAFYWFGRAAELQGEPVQALSYYQQAQKALPPMDPVRADLDGRVEKLAKATSGPPRRPVIRPERGGNRLGIP